jgi:hypothetical protein
VLHALAYPGRPTPDAQDPSLTLRLYAGKVAWPPFLGTITLKGAGEKRQREEATRPVLGKGGAQHLRA